MRIALQRERNAGVSQQIRDDLDRDSSCNAQGGSGVTQVVEPHWPNFRLREQTTKLSLHESLGERHSVVGHKDQVVTWAAVPFSAGSLHILQDSKCFKHEILELH